MPYILLKRSDIDAGTLQTLDLIPNTSLRNFIYDPKGQTGYRLTPPVSAVTLRNNAGVITFASDSEGLVSWFLTNVNDGTGAAATGTLTATLNFGDTETVTIDTKTYTFQTVLTDVDGNVFIGASLADSLDNLRAAINLDAGAGTAYAASTTLHPTVSATDTPTTVVATAKTEGTAGDLIATTETAANASWGGATLSGGADADALTADEALVNANDILDLLAYGDVATPAGALDLAAINGAITTGAITADQVAEVLDILAGRQFFVPAGTQIEAGSAFDVSPAVGTADGPRFDATKAFRRIYDSVALRISLGEGRLALATSNTFTFKGISGAAVAVYNDDGTLY